MSNQHFHEGKEGTEEFMAQDYIMKISEVVGLNPDEVTYNKIQARIMSRHTQGVDAATLVQRFCLNNPMAIPPRTKVVVGRP